jgi:hypothetical protein
MTPDDVDQVDKQLLCILGEAPLTTWEAACGQQAVILTRDRAPALAVLDVESFADWAEATGTAG